MSYFFNLCRKSAGCTHVSAVLHALVALTTTGFQLQPALPSTSLPDEEGAIMPVTLIPMSVEGPQKQKESNLPMSAAVFEKHDYRKQKRHSSSSAVYWLGIKPFREGKSSPFLFLLSLIVFVVIRWVSLCFLTHSTATKPFQLLNQEFQTNHRWNCLSIQG